MVGEIDELEEDIGWSISCLEGVMDVEEGKLEEELRWQTRNHDRNQVLCVALYPNTVFNEMWFLTVDPFIRVSVFIAKLSERQYCWRVFEDFHCQEWIQFFDIHRCLFMRLHFSIGGYGCRRTSRRRQSIHLSRIQVLFADLVHRRKVRRMPLYFLICFQPASTLLHGHIALAIPSLPETDPQILEHWGYADEDHLGKSFQAKDFDLELLRDVQRVSWILHVGLVSVCLSSSAKSMETSAAPYLEIHRPIVV